MRKYPTDKPPYGNFIKAPGMTPDEKRFFKALEVAFGQEYHIFPKVVLYSIISNTDERDFLRIASKHVDFMLYDKTTLEPFRAVELDDNHHRIPVNKAHDDVKDFYLHSAGIPVVRVKIYKTFKPNLLKDLIINSEAAPDIAYPVCPINVEVEQINDQLEE